jgi:lipopolysaccharide transport system permease protein
MWRNLRELYQYRELLISLTQRELTARYRGSVLGFLWTFLNPTLLMLVYSVVFSVYMRQNLPHYTLFMFVGLLPWLWFANSVGAGAATLSERRDLLRKVKFPPQVLPATVVLTNAINFILSLPLIFGLSLLSHVVPTAHAFLIVGIFAAQFAFTLAVSYLVSAVNVTFRDLQHIIANVITFAFFLTPVVYPLTSIPERFRTWALFGNPMAAFITAYQDLLYYHRLPTHVAPLACATGFSVLLLLATATYFDRRREDFAEQV